MSKGPSVSATHDQSIRTPSQALRHFFASNVVWIGVILLVLWTFIPLVWSVSASFKTPNEVYTFGILPESPNVDAYRGVFGFSNFWRYMFNSMFLAVTSTFLSVMASAFAAYAFARFAFRWRHTLLLLILLPRLIPRVSLIVPLYQLLLNVGLLNTRTALVLTYTASAIPLATWILVGFFAALPKDLEEAAAVDGATRFQQLWRIVLPLSVPGLVTVGVLAFRDSWNEFPFVLAFTSGADQRTLPYALFLLSDTVGLQNWPLVNAFALVTIVPILLLYLRFERHVVSGLTSGAVK